MRLELKSPWPDGTTHLHFTELELVEKLAALVPKPHENLLVYHGVLAGNAARRSEYIGFGRERSGRPTPPPISPSASIEPTPNAQQLPARMKRGWATTMKRGLGVDVLVCPRCGERMRVVALVDHPGAVEKIARHLG